MPNIETIGMEDLDRLGIDEENNLYWDRKPLVTEEKITLQKWVNFAIVIGAVSTLCLAIIETLRFLGYSV